MAHGNVPRVGWRIGPAAMIGLVAAGVFAGLAPTVAGAPATGASADMDSLCVNLDLTTGMTDRTASANDDTPSDVRIGQAVPSDPGAVYFGLDAVFSKLVLDIGTAGTQGSLDWWYWKGTAFVPLTVVDETNAFQLTGIHPVTFTPPADWKKKDVNDSNGGCPGEYYYVKASTANPYQVAPAATKISGVPYNLRVKVTSELGTEFPALAQSAFTVAGGTENDIRAFREVGGGVYEFALRTDAADATYDLSVTVDGYVRATKATPALTSALSDMTATPIALPYAFKVTSITSEASTRINQASVATGDNQAVSCVPSAGAFFCPVPLAHTGLSISVASDGYVTNTAKSFAQDRTAASDPQRTGTVTGVLFALRVAVAGENSLSGVAWEKKVGSADYAGVTPEAKVGTSAYFAIPSSEQDVTIRASKQGRSGTTGDPISAAPTGQIVKTIAFTNLAVTPAPTPTTAPPLTAPEDVVFEGVEDGVLEGTHVIVTWTPVEGAEEYILYANDGEEFELDLAVEVATAVTPPLEVNLPEGRKTYTLVARDAKDEVSAAAPQAITVGGTPMDQPVARFQFEMPPTWWFAAAAGGLIVLFILWIIAPSVVGLRPRPGTNPKHGFGWRMRHCRTCEKALPRMHRLFRVLHACLVVGTARPPADAPPAPDNDAGTQR